MMRIYLIICLVFLQTIIPFIHAHAFGLDSYKQHTIHVHDENIASSINNKKFAQFANDNNQQIEGAAITVASGFKQDFSDNITDELSMFAILFTFVLLLFNAPTQLIRLGFQFPHYRRIAYSLQNPRAPPR
jgi:hypothetical protein